MDQHRAGLTPNPDDPNPVPWWWWRWWWRPPPPPPPWRDILAGLTIYEQASVLVDVEARQELQRAAVNLMAKQVEQLQQFRQ